jgi:hypothetical protein
MNEAIRLNSYPRMADNLTPWTDRLVNTLPFRFGLVLLTGLVVAGVCPLVFFANRFLLPGVLKIACIAMLGLVSGFASRRILRENTAFLRLLSAWTALIASLVLLGFLTGGYLGFYFLPRMNPIPHWDWLGQLALGVLAAWLALHAWKPDLKIAPKASKSGAKKAARVGKRTPSRRTTLEPNTRPTRKIRKTSPKTQTLRLRQHWQSGSKLLLNKLHGWQSRANTLAAHTSHRIGDLVSQAQVKINHRWRPVKNHVRLARGKTGNKLTLRKASQVRLVGRAENRCPYCLEIVEKSDPRGVKICPVCHTYHHADCWAVTGTCQVPHYQE